MSKPAPVDDGTFKQMVLDSNKPVLVDFWASWCKPCLAVAPILEELANEYNNKVNFVKMDIDHSPKTPAKYSIMSIPTLLIFKNGAPVSHLVGLRQKGELKKNLDAALA
ncbi:MAG: thioredoxin [Chloroflexota bacterium]